MASFAYTNLKMLLLKAGINLDAGGHDIRVMLVMTNTTADTQEDVATISAITTLDEFDGANYARKTLAGEAVAADTVNNRGEFDHDDVTWTALGVGTRQVQAALYYRHVTNDADSVPIALIDSGGFPVTPNGGDIVYTVNAEGALQAT